MKAEGDTKRPSSSSTHHHQPKILCRFLDFSLRLSSIPLSVASMWVMAKNNQANDAYGKLEFSNLTGLKYLVCISAISAGYALVAAAFSYLRCFNTTHWVFFILDQAVAYLMVTSSAAAAELLYLAHEGDRNVSWSQACDSYGRFCNRVNLSLAFHLTSLLCFLALSLISAYRLFTNYDPPSVSSQEVGEQGDAIS